MTDRVVATYYVRGNAGSIEPRAAAIAVEQSVEMPLDAIDEPAILHDIVGEVQAIEPIAAGVFSVRIGLAVSTIGNDAGQMLNMLFGNTSLHQDVVLHDVAFPPELSKAFGGPRHGIAGLRAPVGAPRRALTCSALKPQGLSAEQLGALAERFARGGIDYIKDDHGMAEQDYSRFADRIRACHAGIARGRDATGHPTRYVPSLSGNLNAMRRQLGLARELGIDCALLAPMIAGFANMQALIREFSEVALFAHPSLGGAARIAPELLIGKLFSLIGADAVIFPNFGGRFGYSPDTCRALADNARQPDHGSRSSMPVPAGGMTLQRVPELLDFYGSDAMLLIGGNLLAARAQLTEATAAFTRAVAAHQYR
ncbi:MAG TPA: RuBisCO large subunit C-terminal-like domain-containing protein [Acetobacteraceae bacterium]|nr:RuBisCO large subunit C-terminal-like domain-containing protein [Acetobacteraceae bacterium]